MWISTILRFHRRQENRSTVVLAYQEREYVHQMEHKEGQVLFQANEILFSICSRLNAAEMLFCTIYVTGEYPSTWWGNYNGEYIVFTKKEYI